MFGDFRTCRSRDKHGSRGNIEGFGTVATRADNIDQVIGVFQRHFGGKFAHHAGCGGNLGNGFNFNPQAGQNGGDLLGRNLAAHDLAHEVGHFIVEKFVVADEAFNRLLRGNHDFSFVRVRCDSGCLKMRFEHCQTPFRRPFIKIFADDSL